MKKMSYLLFIFVLFMIPSFVFAKELEQKNEIVFTGDFDYLYDAVEDHEHNFIVVREKNTSTSNDYYLTKVNSSGEVIWSNKTDYTMSNVSLAVDSNNNIYFLASVDSLENVSVCSSVYVEKTKIVKYASTGEYLGEFSLADVAFYNRFSTISIIDDEIYVLGNTSLEAGNCSLGEPSCMCSVDARNTLVKLSLNGNILWTKNFGKAVSVVRNYSSGISSSTMYGSNYVPENFSDSIIPCDDSICVNGVVTNSSVIAKFSKNGDLVWDKEYNEESFDSHSYINNITYDRFKGFAATVISHETPNTPVYVSSPYNYYLASFATNGVVGKVTESSPEYYKIINADYGYYVVGYTPFQSNGSSSSPNGYFLEKLDYDFNVVDFINITEKPSFMFAGEEGVYVGFSPSSKLIHYTSNIEKKSSKVDVLNSVSSDELVDLGLFDTSMIVSIDDTSVLSIVDNKLVALKNGKTIVRFMKDRVLYEVEVNAVLEGNNPKTGSVFFAIILLLISVSISFLIIQKKKHIHKGI